MAITEGTNAGFVTSAPSGDPGGTGNVIDTLARAVKFTSPSGTNSVSSMGWYCASNTEEANFDIGIYSHDAGNDRPNVLLASAVNQAKGTTAAWKTASVTYDLSASTVYWLGVKLDNTATQTNTQYTTNASYKQDSKNSQTSLPATWGASDATAGRIYPFYALYSAGGAATGFMTCNKGFWGA